MVLAMVFSLAFLVSLPNPAQPYMFDLRRLTKNLILLHKYFVVAILSSVTHAKSKSELSVFSYVPLSHTFSHVLF